MRPDAQRRPGLQPGDTSGSGILNAPLITSLNEGRDSNPATPGRRRPRRARSCPLNEGRDSNPATPQNIRPSASSLSTRSTKAGTPTRRHPAAGGNRGRRSTRPVPLNEGRDSNPATPVLTASMASASRTLNEGRDSNPATPRCGRNGRAHASETLNEGRDSNPATPGDWRSPPRTATALNEGRDSNPATPCLGDATRSTSRPRSTKAGTPTRRHPR